MTILVKNGTVVSPTGAIAADVLIDGERIVALLEPGTTRLGVDLEASAGGSLLGLLDAGVGVGFTDVDVHIRALCAFPAGL